VDVDQDNYVFLFVTGRAATRYRRVAHWRDSNLDASDGAPTDSGPNLANKRGTRRVLISELLRPRAEIDIERPSASWL
jgi:hypothetical protein